MSVLVLMLVYLLALLSVCLHGLVKKEKKVLSGLDRFFRPGVEGSRGVETKTNNKYDYRFRSLQPFENLSTTYKNLCFVMDFC